MTYCGNELPLAYWAYSRGYLLTARESEMEKRLRSEHQARVEAEKKVELLTGILKGR